MTIESEIDFDNYLLPSQDNVSYQIFKSQNMRNLELYWEDIQTVRYESGKCFRTIYTNNRDDILFEWLEEKYILVNRKSKIIVVYGGMDGFLYAAFFSTIVSLILLDSGYLLIHGSLIEYRNKKIAISGVSGSGKSTISAMLIMKGGKLISDDIIAIRISDRFVFPGPPGMRLFSGSPLLNMLENKVEEDDKERGILIGRNDMFSNTISKNIDLFLHLNVKNVDTLIQEPLKGFKKIECLMAELYCKYLLEAVYKNYIIKKNFPEILRISSCLDMYEIIRYHNSDPMIIIDFIDRYIVELSEVQIYEDK
ncbi:MAG: hypothetical protein ACRDBA_17870 [Clostridium sp.]